MEALENASPLEPIADTASAPIKKPSHFGEYFAGFMVLAVIAVIAIAIGSAGNQPENKTSAPQPARIASTQSDPREVEQKQLAAAAEAARKATECRKDLRCWGEKGSIAASVYCRTQIEKLANYSMKWTDSWFESKFSRYRWSRKDPDGKGVVTYLGDKAQFQNGFGAYQNVIYSCDMIPDDKDHTILDVSVSPGRLN